MQSNPDEEANARGNFRSAVEVILTEFPQRKHLHIVAGVQGALQPELEILFRLFAVPDKVVINNSSPSEQYLPVLPVSRAVA